MNISYDFVFPHAPCAILSVDTVDILGSHKVSLEKQTTKLRLEGETGRELGAQPEIVNPILKPNRAHNRRRKCTRPRRNR